jgi:parallel beta-helix repeat protein
MYLKCKKVYAFYMVCLLTVFPLRDAGAHLFFQAQAISKFDIVVPDDFVSIQQAVDAASEGSIIFVRRGVYDEHVDINKMVSLIGEEGATIQEDSEDYPIVKIFRANFAELRGFKLVGHGMSPYAGVVVKYSSGVSLIDNSVSECYYGIEIYDSQNVTLHGNHLAGNLFNLEIWGLVPSHYEHSIDVSNTVDSKPVYYWVDKHNKVVPPDAGYVGLVDCSDILVYGLNLSNNTQGVLLAYTRDSVVLNCSMRKNEYGLHVLGSDGNLMFRNIVANNAFSGVLLDSSSDNNITGNEVFSNRFIGILVSTSPLLNLMPKDNFIGGNVIHDNSYGLKIEYSGENTFSCNTVYKNKFGIALDASQGVVLSRNTVRNNDVGLTLSYIVHSAVYGNNFINNGVQVQFSGNDLSVFNSWNMSYPLGGNYWSSYNGSDEMHGVDQNLTGADGIGDLPYSIGKNNVDYYPYMKPRSSDASPLAKFSFEPSTPVVRHTSVVFRDESLDHDGSIVFRVWSFGDGGFSFDANASRMYMSPGVFKVALFVVDDCGNSAVAQTEVTVRKVVSRVDFSVPARASVGRRFNISVILRDEFSNPIGSVSLQLFVNESGVEEFLGYYTTNESGAVTVSHVFNESGVFSLRAVFMGDAFLNGSEGLCTFFVECPNDYVLVLALVLLCFLGGACLILCWRKRKPPRC